MEKRGSLTDALGDSHNVNSLHMQIEFHQPAFKADREISKKPLKNGVYFWRLLPSAAFIAF